MLNYFISRHLVKITLVIITLTVAVVQLYNLENAPPGALVDEPAFGYSAYSILNDGKDEHGKVFPLIFESYGDQKMPVYVYMLVPVIKFFGLNIFSVRLPSALAAIALTPIVYVLLRQINISKIGALISTLILAFSPFMLTLGRVGRESTVGLFFFIAGVTLLLIGINKKNYKFAIAAALFFCVAWYSYVAYRLILILVIPVLLILLKIGKVFTIKQLILVSIVLTVGCLPSVLSGSLLSARVAQVGIFNDTGTSSEIFEKRSFCSLNHGGILCRIAANKPLIYVRRLSAEFIRAFSPEYLFLTGDKELYIHNVENFGQYYIWTLPFFLISIYAYFSNRERYNPTIWAILLLLVPLSVIPAAIAIIGQKMRSAPFILLMIIPIGLGIEYTLQLLRKKLNPNLFLGALLVPLSALTLSTIIFLTDFHKVHVSKYGMLYSQHIVPVMRLLKEYEGKSEVYISPFFSDPIMYYAFYAKVPPAEYRQNIKYYPRDEAGFLHAKSYKNIHVYDVLGNKEELAKRKEPFIYVTDKQLKIEPIYVGRSDNNVHTLVYVYKIDGLRYNGQ